MYKWALDIILFEDGIFSWSYIILKFSVPGGVWSHILIYMKTVMYIYMS